MPLKTFPHFTLWDFIFERAFSNLHWINILNFVDYDKTKAMDILRDELGWVYYGGKHYESVYTRFFQSYILPKKFNADKRRAHLSCLVCAGEMTRERALEQLEQPICDEALLRQDKEFVIKKFGLNVGEFYAIMAAPHKTIRDYPSYENSWYLEILRFLYRLPRQLKLKTTSRA